MQDIKLTLNPREAHGKQAAKLRDQGIVPSVLYGHGNEPINMQSEEVETVKVVRAAGKHSPVDLVVGDKKQLAIIKTIDIDPVKHRVRHIAFQAISRNEEVTTNVPIHLDGEGESLAEKAGLVVLQALDTVEIKAKPAHLPEALHLSILELASTDDKLTLGDIKLPEGVAFADPDLNLELVIANVYEPSALQAANEAAAGDAEIETEVEAENGSEEAGDDEAADEKSDDEAKKE